MKATLRLLRQPRWAAALVVVVVAAIGFAAAGLWQLDRLESRRSRNVAIRLALDEPVAPLTTEGWREFQRVAVSGSWQGDDEFVLPLQVMDGRSGSHLLTPLATPDGVFLVDRGWVALDSEDSYPRAFGPVSIVASVRRPAAGSVTGGSEGGRPVVSRRDPIAVGQLLGTPLEPIVLSLVEADPNVEPAPVVPGTPELGEGNHLLYAIQWFSFIGIVVVGFAALLWRQSRSARLSQPIDESRPIEV